VTGGLLGKRVAILATDGVERCELEVPRGALYGAGASSDIVSPHDGEIQARQMDIVSAGTLAVDRTLATAVASDYDALLLPGSTVNPDSLRVVEDAIQFVKSFISAGRSVGAICHGPWTLLEAGAVDGRRMTSWPSLRTDLRCGGAEWVDEQVVIDGPLTTSRSPSDLPAFCAAIVEQFAT
jgi:protease I